jgi:TolB protein
MARSLRLIIAAFCFLVLSSARAQLNIEIVGSGANQIPIAIVPFGNENTYPLGISGVVGADLQRSGLFRLVDTGGIVPRPVEPAEVRFDDFKARGSDAIVIGRMQPLPNGEVQVDFRLLDGVQRTQLAGFSYTVTPAQFRATAHKIADVIYEKLTGDVGVFSTRITYVVKSGRRYELQVADADGYSPQTIVASNEPIISPAWSPDGNRLAYVSFEDKKPVVYVQNLSTGARIAAARFRGSNSAPSWSPDGSHLVVTLTKDNYSQLYLIGGEGGGNAQRLTNSSTIDTEASFSPDGSNIMFTSDRGGSPQIYRMPASGGNAERLTFEGSYNVSPRYSPDGKSFVYVRRDGGRFNIAVEDIASRQVQVLTSGSLDESPTFAPNGKMILYASSSGGRGILAAVSSDGRVKQRLVAASGDVREPAWGPLPRR